MAGLPSTANVSISWNTLPAWLAAAAPSEGRLTSEPLRRGGVDVLLTRPLPSQAISSAAAKGYSGELMVSTAVEARPSGKVTEQRPERLWGWGWWLLGPGRPGVTCGEIDPRRAPLRRRVTGLALAKGGGQHPVRPCDKTGRTVGAGGRVCVSVRERGGGWELKKQTASWETVKALYRPACLLNGSYRARAPARSPGRRYQFRRWSRPQPTYNAAAGRQGEGRGLCVGPGKRMGRN